MYFNKTTHRWRINDKTLFWLLTNRLSSWFWSGIERGKSDEAAQSCKAETSEIKNHQENCTKTLQDQFAITSQFPGLLALPVIQSLLGILTLPSRKIWNKAADIPTAGKMENVNKTKVWQRKQEFARWKFSPRQNSAFWRIRPSNSSTGFGVRKTIGSDFQKREVAEAWTHGSQPTNPLFRKSFSSKMEGFFPATHAWHVCFSWGHLFSYLF